MVQSQRTIPVKLSGYKRRKTDATSFYIAVVFLCPQSPNDRTSRHVPYISSPHTINPKIDPIQSIPRLTHSIRYAKYQFDTHAPWCVLQNSFPVSRMAPGHLRLSGHPAVILQSVFYVATEGSMYLGIGVLPTSAELAPVSGKFSVSSSLPGYVSLAKVNFAFL